MKAQAHSNIALVKYWGKRDAALNLPHKSSIGVTLNTLSVLCDLEFKKGQADDELYIDGRAIAANTSEYRSYFLPFMNSVRCLGRTELRAVVRTETNFPVASGLASSSAAYAALALAVNEALSLKLSSNELSVLARLGSGSACRALCGGFVLWHRGELSDGSDSIAEELLPSEHWPELRVLICIVEGAAKKVSSRNGMAKSQLTSPYFNAWLDGIDEDLACIERGIENRDFKVVGECAESNCLRMHACALSAQPAIIYWSDATLNIMHTVIACREEGTECYFTIDAGAHVKVLCKNDKAQELARKLSLLSGVKKVLVSGLGGAARCLA